MSHFKRQQLNTNNIYVLQLRINATRPLTALKATTDHMLVVRSIHSKAIAVVCPASTALIATKVRRALYTV